MTVNQIVLEPVSRGAPAPIGAGAPRRNRYPVGPVLASARQVLHRELSIEELGEFLEVSRATAYRREKDGLTEQEADNLACHLLTVHPYCVWPEWFDDIAEIDEEAELADDLATCA